MQNKVCKYLQKLIFKLIIIFYNFNKRTESRQASWNYKCNKKKKNPLMGYD